jgi:hypothetical protein
MPPAEETILTIAEIARDSAAMNEAALAGDFDEARFLAVLVASKAEAASMVDVAQAADDLVIILGPVGTEPNADLGAAMVRVADALDMVGSKPR